MTLCADCGAWACVEGCQAPYCLSCAFRLVKRHTLIVLSREPIPFAPSAMVAPHFTRGLPKAPVVVNAGKSWPELVAEAIR